MKVEVKLRLPDSTSHQSLSSLLSPYHIKTHLQENIFFHGSISELLSKRPVIRLRFYNDDSPCVVSLKAKAVLVGGVNRVEEEDEEEIDPVIGRACVSEPCKLGCIDSSRILERVKEEFGVDNEFVCLGGFKNVRNVYDWKGLKLELDQTSYDFGTCYEIECESEDPEGVKKLLEAFLKENGVSYSYSEASKFAIFRSGMLPEYTIKEDEQLCHAYVMVMYHGVTGNGKRKDYTKDMYWERIHEVYHALSDDRHSEVVERTIAKR